MYIIHSVIYFILRAKDASRASEARTKGNELFSKKKFLEARLLYTQSIVFAKHNSKVCSKWSL